MLTDPPPRFSPAGSPVYRLRATLPVATAEDGSPVLPGFVLWAFSLNEGDLLAVSPGEVPAGSCRFLSYGESVWSAAEGGDAVGGARMTRIRHLDAERLSPTDASSLLGIPYELVLRYVRDAMKTGRPLVLFAGLPIILRRRWKTRGDRKVGYIRSPWPDPSCSRSTTTPKCCGRWTATCGASMASTTV